MLYSDDRRFGVMTNGSFLVSPTKFEYFKDILVRTRRNQYDDIGGVSIFISNDIYHQSYQTPNHKLAIKNLEYVLKYPEQYGEEYGYDDYEEYDNVFLDPQSSSDQYPRVNVGSPKEDYRHMNPSGRALENDCYNHNHQCSCFMTNTYEDTEDLEILLRDTPVVVNWDEQISFCCSCDGCKIGHISDFSSIKDIHHTMLRYRKQFRKQYEVDSNSKMIDLCSKCKEFRMNSRQSNSTKQTCVDSACA